MQTHGELVEWSSILDVLEGRVQVTKLTVDLGGGLLGRLDLRAESSDIQEVSECVAIDLELTRRNWAPIC